MKCGENYDSYKSTINGRIRISFSHPCFSQPPRLLIKKNTLINLFAFLFHILDGLLFLFILPQMVPFNVL